jgi:hypothetical protein
MTRSEFGYFCAGVAAGALGHKFYPQLQQKLAPYMAGAMVFAQQAFGDAMKNAMEAAEAMQAGAGPVGADFFATASEPAGAADSATPDSGAQEARGAA